ncbi:MAG: YdcF family protein [Hyphomicrobiales bacterium]|nr:YdcF family protein [Hyphomicrobiales bacterium]
MTTLTNDGGSRRAKLLALVTAKTAGLLAGLFIIGFVLFAANIERKPGAAQQRADGIVALTGGEARIAEAIRLLGNNYGKRLLISGVNPATTRLQLIRLNPQNAGLFRCCIDLDKNAVDTVGNAEETAAWVRRRGFKSLIVVTSSYHMPRSLMELRRELPDTALIPYPVKPVDFETEQWWNHPTSFKILLSEYLKMYPSFVRYTASRLFSAGSPAPAQAEACAKTPATAC